MPRRKAPVIYVVSDGHGDTANMVVTAAALQFEGQKHRLVVKRNVRKPERVVSIVEKAAEEKASIFYTLVAKETRRAMRVASTEHSVPIVDILGPAFRALNDVLGSRRGANPGLMYAADRERIERRVAIEYTLTHDDGQRPQELDKADVVLVGVSRASKSSTCFYLAYEGIRAANVPLIPNVELPSKLMKLPKAKVIGLRINTHRLMAIREARADGLGLKGEEGYLDKRSISREIVAANRLMEDSGWRSFDTSYMAIEEIAKEVIRLRGLKGRRPW